MSSNGYTFEARRVKLEDIELHSRQSQIRVQIDPDAIKEYKQMWIDSDRYPFDEKVKLFENEEGKLHIGDGWHRIVSAHMAGKTFLNAEVAPGTIVDAITYASESNAKRGVRITTKDKRRAVRLLLSHAKKERLTMREIARRCYVSHTFVQNMVKELKRAAEQKAKGPKDAPAETHTAGVTTRHAPVDRVTRDQLGLPPIAEVRNSTDKDLQNKIAMCEQGISTSFKLLPQYIRNRMKLLGIQTDEGAEALIAMIDDVAREYNDWKKASAKAAVS